jgi:hypothetical protein
MELSQALVDKITDFLEIVFRELNFKERGDGFERERTKESVLNVLGQNNVGWNVWFNDRGMAGMAVFVSYPSLTEKKKKAVELMFNINPLNSKREKVKTYLKMLDWVDEWAKENGVSLILKSEFPEFNVMNSLERRGYKLYANLMVKGV